MCHIIKQLMTFNSIDTRFINPKIIYLPWPLDMWKTFAFPREVVWVHTTSLIQQFVLLRCQPGKVCGRVLVS